MCFLGDRELGGGVDHDPCGLARCLGELAGRCKSRQPLGPRGGGGASSEHERATGARGCRLKFVDRRIIRARDRHDRTGGDHRPTAGLVVEVRRDEAEAAGSHVGDADASQCVVAQEPLKSCAP